MTRKAHRRGGACVKSNIVYNLCKDIVYTFGITINCVGKSNGAERRETFQRGAPSKAPYFTMNKLACMYVKFCDCKVSVASSERISVRVRSKLNMLINHRFA